MLRWDNARTTTQKFCQDSSADAKAFQDLMLNAGYKEVLVALERQITELQADLELTANQREYQVPPDVLMPKGVVVIQNNNRYPLFDVSSDLEWEYRTNRVRTGRPESFHYRPRLGVSGGTLELDPIPSDGYSMEMTYEATERDLSQLEYTTGNIALNNGSAAVVGSGTTFTQDMIGRYLMPTEGGSQRLPYRIKTFTDATHITLENVYHGLTDSSVTFEVFEMFALPDDCHMLPCFYAAWQWWSTKGNVIRSAQFKKQYADGLEDARMRHALTTRNNIITPTDFSLMGMVGGADYPSWFPETIS